MYAIAFFDARTNNGIFGNIHFSQTTKTNAVEVNISLSGFRPNSRHALHIHEFGDLTGGCKTTGSHFNPFNSTHGSVLYTGRRHAGDLLNNIISDKRGNVNICFTDHLLSLDPAQKNSILGRSVVIHEHVDDYGLQGVLHGKTFVPYDSVPLDELKKMAIVRGYDPSGNLVQKFNRDSLTTGNAGGRLACAIIGIAGQ